MTLVMLPRPAQYAFTALAVVAIGCTGTLGMARDHDDGELLLPDTGEVVARLAADGYDRGYSGYWTSSILTYFADVPVLPVHCSDARLTVPYDWLVDMGRFHRAVANPGDRSFIVVDRRVVWSLSCSDERLIAQHGPPTAVIGVRDEIEVWLYDGDDVVADMVRAWAR